MNQNHEGDKAVTIVPHNEADAECAALLTVMLGGPELEAKLLEGYRNIWIYGVSEPTDEQRARAFDFASKSDG